MKKEIIITASILLITVANYVGVVNDGSVRAVQFLSILAIGMATGVLLTQIIMSVKNKNKTS